jgi:hypothetical protein
MELQFTNFVKYAIFEVLTMPYNSRNINTAYYTQSMAVDGKWDMGKASNLDEYIQSTVDYLMNKTKIPIKTIQIKKMFEKIYINIKSDSDPCDLDPRTFHVLIARFQKELNEGGVMTDGFFEQTLEWQIDELDDFIDNNYNDRIECIVQKIFPFISVFEEQDGENKIFRKIIDRLSNLYVEYLCPE